MNKSDSERIESLLLNLGLKGTEKPEKANLIIINTCSVRQSAEDRVFGQIRNLAKLKKKNPRLLIAVTGCMPGRDKDGKLRAKLPEVDLWFPIKDLPGLPEMLNKQILKSGEFCAAAQNSPHVSEDYFCIFPSNQTKFQAFIPIQTGCNQFCAYCVVPYARGQEKSRPLKYILDEICYLAHQGCLEVTLLGQTVNSYQAPDSRNFSKKNPYKNPSCLPFSKRGSDGDFAALLWEINQIPGIERIYFTAPHPLYITDDVIDALTLPKMVNYLHLPVQSGDNEILRKMNRKHTREFYLKLIKKIRAKKPDIALGTDIIVGFPGETKKQFQKTVDLYKKAQFDIAYIAMYSPRSGTLAAKKLKDDVPQTEKKRRWQTLQKLMEQITLKKNKKYLGKTLEVLTENLIEPKDLNYRNSATKVFRPDEAQYLGLSREMKQTRFNGPRGLVGKIVKVKINKAFTWELRGKYAP